MGIIRELVTVFRFDTLGTDVKVNAAIDMIKANLTLADVAAKAFTNNLKMGLAQTTTEAVRADIELKKIIADLGRIGHGATIGFGHATAAAHGFHGVLWEIIGILGLEIGLHSVVEMSDQWSMVSTTIKNATANAHDYRQVMDAIYKQSQTAGVSMEGPSNLFAQIASARADNHLNNDQILKITDTVTKALALGHKSNTSNQRSIRQVDDFFALGKITQQHLTALTTDSPMLARFLREAAGGAKALHEAVKSGKADSQYIINLFNKIGPLVDTNFAKMGITFAGAAQRIKNAIEDVWGRLFVETGLVSDALRGVVDIFEWLHDAIIGASDAVGGFTNLAELAGIAILAAFGPAALKALAAFVARTWELAAANLAAMFEWAILAGAIVLAGLAIQDILTWMRGGNSLIGDWLGNFQQYAPALKRAEDVIRSIYHWFMSIVQSIDWRQYGQQIYQAFNQAFGNPRTKAALTELLNDAKTLSLYFLYASMAVVLFLAKFGAPIAKWALLNMVKQLVDDLRVAFDLMSNIIQLVPKAGSFLADAVPGGSILKDLFKSLTGGNSPMPQTVLPRSSASGGRGGAPQGVSIVNTNYITAPNSDPSTIAAGVSDGMSRGLTKGFNNQGLSVAFPASEFGVI